MIGIESEPVSSASVAAAVAAPLHWPAPVRNEYLLRDECLHQLFEAQADLRPDATAIVQGHIHLTYRSLDERANQWAHLLHARGMGAGSVVAFCLPRGFQAFAVMLGILKAGAAYLPLDVEFPDDRIGHILSDAGASAVIVDSAGTRRFTGVNPKIPVIEATETAIAQSPCHRLRGLSIRQSELAYIIYTSGTTGSPKGVAIEHRSVCHLVRAEAGVLPVWPDDRVFQGFSLAFDASIEEIWLAFFSGATLVLPPVDLPRLGDELARFLTSQGVTVVSTVPTLLSTFEEDLPTVRLLILGGEACPQDMARRWCRSGRRVVNTYGPTETTVIATWADLQADRPVTIGRALPNYRVYLLDPSGQAVADHAIGELCIGGVGVARGYLGRPALTREKFNADPFIKGSDPFTRLYRSGDLARFNDQGELEFHGRLDSQVKIRGYRVELAEIESVLAEMNQIAAAVVACRHDLSVSPALVAYVTLHPGAVFDARQARAALRRRLPAYMVPAYIETLDAFPRLAASGKVDLTQLPKPTRLPSSISTTTTWQSEREQTIGQLWAKLFFPETIEPTAHFFTDLGGHSLFAATMVSELRMQPGFEALSISDVYAHPTVRQLAAELEGREVLPQAQPSANSAPHDESALRRRHLWCSAAQFVLLYPLAGLIAIEYLGPYLAYAALHGRGVSVPLSLLAALAFVLVMSPAMLLTSIACKWLVLGRVKPGRHPLWGTFFLRWWFTQRILELAPTDTLIGTPWLNWYCRLLGACIGRNVHLATDNIATFDLLCIGENTHVGQESSLLGYAVEDGHLILGNIAIGMDCTIGARSVLAPNAIMEDATTLGDLSLLPSETRIPAGEHWHGSPARPGAVNDFPVGITRPSRIRRHVFGVAQGICALLLPGVYLLALFPGVWLLNAADHAWGHRYAYLLLSPVVAAGFVVLACTLVVCLKWFLLGRVKPGVYSTHSAFYLRKWCVDQLLNISLDLLGPLYATLYLNIWLRCLGATMGKRAEISTASTASPDLLSLGDESFVADAVSLGHERLAHHQVALARTIIGRRAFVGNSAAVAGGQIIGESTLIGVLSTAPASSDGEHASAAQPDTDWLGSPAFFLPQRAKNTAFAAECTFNPTPKLYAQRLSIELARIILPTTFYIALSGVFISTILWIGQMHGWTLAALISPLAYLLCGLCAALIVIGTKWLVMGIYKPGERPLWSHFVWRTEFLVAMHEGLADVMLIRTALGTPIAPWFFRAMGASIGKRALFDTTALTEFDLLHLGNDVALNSDATLQTHLFEDRVMKMSTLRIGDRSTIGAGSVVLYDTQLGDDVTVSALTLVMKGESLPSRTRWHGSPARPM